MTGSGLTIVNMNDDAACDCPAVFLMDWLVGDEWIVAAARIDADASYDPAGDGERYRALGARGWRVRCATCGLIYCDGLEVSA